MERREFLKGACTCGLCSCAGIATLGQGIAFAETEDSGAQPQDWKLVFAQRRLAQLVEIMNSNLEEETRDQLLEALGRQCAKDSNIDFSKYKNNLQGFLDDLEKQWAEHTEYDEKTGVAKIVGKKTDSCFCPMAQGGLTPVELCNCTRGWQKETFETITGKAVEVKIAESILRGGERCTFEIRMT